ncbi:MAG: type II toxin-antitoxin system RelE/ParE family toxin [Rhodoferax sp.]|uniref:type II toxin-antitoxin system RelE/ParE family toxin n=1 Tax=Rhodoferax sp. TaxID=50421 RepID=UPI002615E945|nr:type II toxin-antitoxin system RelE/ParE family toxin [Rhodoferax sp.]MDD2879113.1 type II toxin-antitoxin system RelE/ParE family toxin [Rhodoferax sp.]
MNFSLIPDAQAELDDAFQWYETQSGGLGDRFLGEVVHAFELIRQFPSAWHPLSANTRRCRLKRFPYGVIYAQVGDDIVVVGIAHLHREPNYWSERFNSDHPQGDYPD